LCFWFIILISSSVPQTKIVQNRKRKSLQQKMSSDLSSVRDFLRRCSSATTFRTSEPIHPGATRSIANTNSVDDLHLASGERTNYMTLTSGTVDDGRNCSTVTLSNILTTPSLSPEAMESSMKTDHHSAVQVVKGSAGSEYSGAIEEVEDEEEEEEPVKGPPVESLENKIEQGEIFSRQSGKTLDNNTSNNGQERDQDKDERTQLVRIDVGFSSKDPLNLSRRKSPTNKK
jgi:hypothetical protein